eukprot:191499-Rhodomonas_salina.1
MRMVLMLGLVAVPGEDCAVTECAVALLCEEPPTTEHLLPIPASLCELVGFVRQARSGEEG